ncbi:MAG: hypothetical protein EXR81_01780 [Gammaproteobacteria bacterium]|nr:hypothetical protein [Gammaproteobacteria bacterium]
MTGWVTAYLMVYKMVAIGNVLETGAIFLFPLSYAIADIVSEVYGYKIEIKNEGSNLDLTHSS